MSPIFERGLPISNGERALVQKIAELEAELQKLKKQADTGINAVVNKWEIERLQQEIERLKGISYTYD